MLSVFHLDFGFFICWNFKLSNHSTLLQISSYSHGWLKIAVLCLQPKLLFLLALYVMAWTSVSGRETQINCCYDQTTRQQKNLHVIIKYMAKTSKRMITTHIATCFLEQQLLPTEGQKNKDMGNSRTEALFLCIPRCSFQAHPGNLGPSRSAGWSQAECPGASPQALVTCAQGGEQIPTYHGFEERWNGGEC